MRGGAAARRRRSAAAARRQHGAAHEKDEETEEQHVADSRERLEDGADEHGHARHALERTERAQRTHGAHRREVAEPRQQDGQPCEGDDDKVELAPRVAQVRVGAVEEEAVREDLGAHLERVDAEEPPLAHLP
jgi:hypothetical protein